MGFISLHSILEINTMISLITRSKRRSMEDTIITLQQSLQAVIVHRNFVFEAQEMRIDRLLVQVKEWRGRHQLSGNAEYVLNHINMQLIDIHDRVVDALRSVKASAPTTTPDSIGHDEGGVK